MEWGIMKSKKQLESFTAYCNQYPEQRFFQALRNWYAQTIDKKVNFILTAEVNNNPRQDELWTNEKDTFYQ